jgi:hypothetical protein
MRCILDWAKSFWDKECDNNFFNLDTADFGAASEGSMEHEIILSQGGSTNAIFSSHFSAQSVLFNFIGPFFQANALKGVQPPIRRSFGFLATIADRGQAH